jgi:hypothetical protein
MPEANAIDALRKDVDDLHARLSVVEHSHSSMREAFIQNDLGKPDYDGHRRGHKQLVKDSEVVEGYQIDATKKVVGAVVLGVLTLTMTGALEWLKAHIR